MSNAARKRIAGRIQREQIAPLHLRFARAVVQARAEILTFGAVIAGWAFLTATVAHLTSPIAWLASAGLLLFSAVGWKLLITVAAHGLYKLTRGDE